MRDDYDVLVLGGGTAGVIAAIQAARAGAATLLVEKNGMLGGTMIAQGINAPAHFFAWGRQIIAGIPWELYVRTKTLAGEPIPTPEYTRGTGTPRHISINPVIHAAVCDAAVVESGADLLMHAMPATVAYAEGAGWTVGLCLKTGLRPVRAKVLIDATGDANAVQMAGFPVNRPELVQPATLQMRCSGYDRDALDYDALAAAAEQAVAAGELMVTDIGWFRNGPKAFLQRYGNNANHMRSPDAHTSEGKTAVELEARRSVLRMVRFFRQQPGLEGFQVDWICPEAGIRETATIRGKATVTTADYMAGRRYEDALCHAFYPIDEHLNDGDGTHYVPLAEGVVPTIPRGALLPADSRFLIVAGRSLSSERDAHSALRVQCPCMAMGQAAGAMAALSARTGQDPEALPLADIYDLLRAHAAIVPD